MDMAWPALRSLHELSRLGTIAAVTAATGYTPGAISQQVAGLERAVGRPLLMRVGRGVRLTDAGAVLAEHAERLLRSEQAARHALEAFGDEIVATIRVATFASSAATLLAPSIAAATMRHPRLRVRTVEVDVDTVAEVVARGDADLAFGLDYPDAPVPRARDVELTRVATERFSLAVPERWAAAGTVALVDTADWDWILPPVDTAYGRAVRTAFRRAGFEPRVAHLVTDTAVSQVMVAQGLGTTVVTAMMLALAPRSGFRTVHLRDDVRRHVVLVSRIGPRATRRPRDDVGDRAGGHRGHRSRARGVRLLGPRTRRRRGRGRLGRCRRSGSSWTIARAQSATGSRRSVETAKCACPGRRARSRADSSPSTTSPTRRTSSFAWTSSRRPTPFGSRSSSGG